MNFERFTKLFQQNFLHLRCFKSVDGQYPRSRLPYPQVRLSKQVPSDVRVFAANSQCEGQGSIPENEREIGKRAAEHEALQFSTKIPVNLCALVISVILVSLVILLLRNAPPINSLVHGCGVFKSEFRKLFQQNVQKTAIREFLDLPNLRVIRYDIENFLGGC